MQKRFWRERYRNRFSCYIQSWRLQQQGYDLILLKIKVDAAYSKNALYSDINAADSNHTHGSTIEHLKRVDFSATKQHYVSRESPFFKKRAMFGLLHFNP